MKKLVANIPRLINEEDLKYLKLTVKLARKGYGRVLGNPLVGAVLVKNNKVLATGYHAFFGAKHAEADLFSKVSVSAARDATLYVNLEPCVHYGKTPPCVLLFEKYQIARVVVASLDCDERVNGRGKKLCEDLGIRFDILPLKEVEFLNRRYFKFKKTKKPYVTLKMAISLDGKITAKEGVRTAISEEATKKRVDKLRAAHSAILVGRGTLLVDDPHLGVGGLLKRGYAEPCRILLSKSGLVENSAEFQFFRDSNVAICKSVEEVERFCRRQNLASLLVEGGSKVFESFLESDMVDEIVIFLSAKLFGVEGVGVVSKNLDISRFKLAQVKRLSEKDCFLRFVK